MPIVQIIVAYLPIHLLSRMVGPALVAAGRTDIDIRNVVVLLFLVSVTTVTGAFFGPFWAAVGWITGSFAGLIINMRRSLPVLGTGYRELAAEIGATVACAAIMTLAVWGMMGSPWLRDFGQIGELAAVVTLGAALYVAASVLFNGKVLRRFIATALNRAAVPTTENLV